MSTFTYVLYSVQSGSQGCENAKKIIDENLKLKSIVHIQDIKTIEKPLWLKGVPVLAKVSTKEIWEGTSAIEQLKYLSGYYSSMSTVLSSKNINQPWEKYTSNLAIQPLMSPSTQPPLQMLDGQNNHLLNRFPLSETPEPEPHHPQLHQSLPPPSSPSPAQSLPPPSSSSPAQSLPPPSSPSRPAVQSIFTSPVDFPTNDRVVS